MRKRYLMFFFVLSILLISCVGVNKGIDNKQQSIKLKNLGDVERLVIHNDLVKMSLSKSDVVSLIENSKSEKQIRLLQYLNSHNSPRIEISRNNLEMKSDYQEALLPAMRELLMSGNAEIFDLGSGQKVNEIIVVFLAGLGGEQEAFKFKEGKVFYTQVISF
jgi:hypothetical protein